MSLIGRSRLLLLMEGFLKRTLRTCVFHSCLATRTLTVFIILPADTTTAVMLRGVGGGIVRGYSEWVEGAEMTW